MSAGLLVRSAGLVLPSLWRLNSLAITIRLAIARCRDFNEENLSNLSAPRSSLSYLVVFALALNTLRTSGSLVLSLLFHLLEGYSLVS